MANVDASSQKYLGKISLSAGRRNRHKMLAASDQAMERKPRLEVPAERARMEHPEPTHKFFHTFKTADLTGYALLKAAPKTSVAVQRSMGNTTVVPIAPAERSKVNVPDTMYDAIVVGSGLNNGRLGGQRNSRKRLRHAGCWRRVADLPDDDYVDTCPSGEMPFAVSAMEETTGRTAIQST